MVLNSIFAIFSAFPVLFESISLDSTQWFTKDEAKENIKKNSLAEYFLNAYLNEVQGA